MLSSQYRDTEVIFDRSKMTPRCTSVLADAAKPKPALCKVVYAWALFLTNFFECATDSEWLYDSFTQVTLSSYPGFRLEVPLFHGDRVDRCTGAAVADAFAHR